MVDDDQGFIDLWERLTFGYHDFFFSKVLTMSGYLK